MNEEEGGDTDGGYIVNDRIDICTDVQFILLGGGGTVTATTTTTIYC